jgi:hypothetical protein
LINWSGSDPRQSWASRSIRSARSASWIADPGWNGGNMPTALSATRDESAMRFFLDSPSRRRTERQRDVGSASNVVNWGASSGRFPRRPRRRRRVRCCSNRIRTSRVDSSFTAWEPAPTVTHARCTSTWGAFDGHVGVHEADGIQESQSNCGGKPLSRLCEQHRPWHADRPMGREHGVSGGAAVQTRAHTGGVSTRFF